jgi:hypothetical protein
VPKYSYRYRYLQGKERETSEHKLKLLKRKLEHIIKNLTYINNFVFADPIKRKATAHCTHLQIAQACPQPKFAKECNHSQPTKCKI